ncbi:MAG: hypothetical protein WBO35_02905 [Candidatus Saccharimonadales bacterium]
MQDDIKGSDDRVTRRSEFGDSIKQHTFEAHSLETGAETEVVPVDNGERLEVVALDPAPSTEVTPGETTAPAEPDADVFFTPPSESDARQDGQSDVAPAEEPDSGEPAPDAPTPIEESLPAGLSATTVPTSQQTISSETDDLIARSTQSAEAPTPPSSVVDDEHLLPSHTAAAAHSFSLSKLLIPLLAVLIGAALAFGAYKLIAGYKHTSTVNKTFDQALANVFATKSFTKQVVYNQANYTESNYDVSDAAHPKMSAKTFITAGGVSGFGAASYSTLDNTYVKFTPDTPSEAQKKFADKWIQVRKDGKIPPTVDTNLLELYDVRFTAFGLTSLGNFTTAQQKTLTDYIKQNKVFVYEPSAVKTQRSNAENLYMFPVTAEARKIAALSKKIADMVGYGMAPDLSKSKASFKANLWVNADTKRIVQIETTKNGQPVSYNFYNFDKTTLPTEPSAELGWSDYAADK